MIQRIICSIFRSSRRDEMYLYVPKADGTKRVPDALLEQFGRCEHVMDLMLTPERKLARADIALVLEALETKGYYLQLPPPDEAPAITEFNKRLETGDEA